MSASTLEQQTALVDRMLMGHGFSHTQIARYVGWTVAEVKEESIRLTAERASVAGGALPEEDADEPESPQRPLPAPTAVATSAEDAQAQSTAKSPLQATPRQGASATPAPLLPAWVTEARAASAQPLPPRRRLGPAAPAPRRGLLDWLAPREGDAPVRTPWRKVAAWAGGVAAVVVLASLALAPHDGTAAATGATLYYRCTLPGGSVVMTTSQAECASDVASIPQAQPTVPTVATIPPYAPPASTAPSQPPAASQPPVSNPPATTPAPQTAPAPQPAASAPSNAPGPVYTPGHGLTIVGGTSAQPSTGVRAAECWIERLPKGANGC